MELIFEKSVSGRKGFRVPARDVPVKAEVPARYRRTEDCPWPQVSELDVVRHMTRLSHRNFSIDTNFYPLGSCTMKYNPKFTEAAAGIPPEDFQLVDSALADADRLAKDLVRRDMGLGA